MKTRGGYTIKVLVGMSGGVDSTAAAYLLSERGFDVCGVTLELCGNADGRAYEACLALGIEHRVIDFSDIFRQKVINPFLESYRLGLTPNPCVECNRSVKFGALLDYALKMGFDFLATGHYARIEDRRLKKGIDLRKDQSYVLHSINRGHLGRLLFPLGDMTKASVREVLAGAGLSCAGQGESQDICFIPDKDCAGFVAKNDPQSVREWIFTDSAGKTLGSANGPGCFTVGQRKGLRLALGSPSYITGVRASDGVVTMGGNEELFTRELTVDNFNWLCDPPQGPFRAAVKIRYSHTEHDAEINTEINTNRQTVSVLFDEPQRAVTPGQFAVLYDGDTVLGGGAIRGLLNTNLK